MIETLFLQLSNIARTNSYQLPANNLRDFLSTIEGVSTQELNEVVSIFVVLTATQKYDLDLEIHHNGFTLYAFEEAKMFNFDRKIKALNNYFEFCQKHQLFK